MAFSFTVSTRPPNPFFCDSLYLQFLQASTRARARYAGRSLSRKEQRIEDNAVALGL